MKSTRINRRFGLHRLMIAPALILFFLFFLFPMIQGMFFAFTNWDGFNDFQFIGLKNFREFFTDERALVSVRNTVFFGFWGTILLNFLGFLYAILLDTQIKLKGLIRTIVYLPAIISPLIMGYIWFMILSSENGALLGILKLMGAERFFHDWLAEPNQAVVVIIIIQVWQFVGGDMIIYLAGLQNIPLELEEASRIDGAGWAKILWFIKLPLLAPSIRINIVTNIIGSMSIFDSIMALTGGGPGYATESLSITIFRMSGTNRAGYTSAVAMIMFIIILIPAALSFKAMKKKEVTL